MLTVQQYQILNSCSDDWELFYFPFAEVNFGGQVLPRDAGPNYAQYVDEGAWPVKVSAAAIASDLVVLTVSGLIKCNRVRADGSRVEVDQPTSGEFDVYSDYACLTFDQHIERFGYGPHEFYASERGKRELSEPAYRAYDQQLGWDK